LNAVDRDEAESSSHLVKLRSGPPGPRLHIQLRSQLHSQSARTRTILDTSPMLEDLAADFRNLSKFKRELAANKIKLCNMSKMRVPKFKIQPQ
jgi:hypothetical protein